MNKKNEQLKDWLRRNESRLLIFDILKQGGSYARLKTSINGIPTLVNCKLVKYGLGFCLKEIPKENPLIMTFKKMERDAQLKSSPIIEEGQEVLILLYSNNLESSSVLTVKAGKPMPGFPIILDFEDV